MTMRILNMITFSVIAIPQPQQQLTDSKRAKGAKGDWGGGEGGGSE